MLLYLIKGVIVMTGGGTPARPISAGIIGQRALGFIQPPRTGTTSYQINVVLKTSVG